MPINILTPSGVRANFLHIISYKIITGTKKVEVIAGAFLDEKIIPLEENALQVFEFEFFAGDFPEKTIQEITEATIELTKKVATMPEFTK